MTAELPNLARPQGVKPGRVYRIVAARAGRDALKETEWPDHHAWMADRLEAFRACFAARQAALPGTGPAAGPAVG